MDAVALKVALLRAGVSQGELARRLGHGRGMVAGWVAANRVPPEWVEIVYEKLGLDLPPPVLGAFSSLELLDELRAREARRGVDIPSGTGDNSGHDVGSLRGYGAGPPDL